MFVRRWLKIPIFLSQLVVTKFIQPPYSSLYGKVVYWWFVCSLLCIVLHYILPGIFYDPTGCGAVHHDNTNTSFTKRIDHHCEILERLPVILVLWMQHIQAKIQWPRRLRESEYWWIDRQCWQRRRSWYNRNHWRYKSRIIVYRVFVKLSINSYT